MEQTTIFDAIASAELKKAGMEKAAKNNPLLAFAKQLAVEIAKRKGCITADDVAFELHRKGYSIFSLGNAAGSLFKGKQWQWTGESIPSVRAHAHGNLLKVWRLRKF